MTDTSGPLLPPRVDEGYYTAYQSPNVFGRESARFAGEALESARQSAAAAGESPGAYLPNIAMSGLNLADAGLRYGIGAFSELLGGTPAQESRLMREIYGIPEAFAGSGFIRGASALDDLLEASTANRALRNEMGLANFRARTAGFTPDAPRPVNYFVPTPDELARMEADSTPAQADYLLRRREALALKNEGVSNEEIFAETGIDFIPVRGADGELMDEIPALPTGPSQVNIDRLQELFAQGEGASAPLSEIVSPNETLMGLRGEIPGRVEITSSGPGVGSFDRKTGTIRINPNRATPEMVEDVFRHENVHSIMGSGGSARTLGGANALSEADLTQQYLGLARTARADARSRLESGEITQDQFDEINRRISAAEEGMLVTPSERYTRDIGELLAREAMDPQFGTMSVALTPSEALNPLIRPNVGLIQRADQAASAALLPYRRLARMDEAINRGISTLSAPLSRFFPDEKPRTPAAMLSTLRTQPTVPVPQSRAMARESFSTISPSDIVSEVAAGGRRNAPRYMTLDNDPLMSVDRESMDAIRAELAANARRADSETFYNDQVAGGVAEDVARDRAMRRFGVDPVTGAAARGPREFARGGEVMMRGNMSKQLEGGIGGFAGDAKNMFRGPRGLEGFAQYMQAGGEVGRGQGQGSTVGRPVSGSAMGTNLGADEEFLTSVRNRVIAQSGVDPIDVAMEEGVDPDLFLRLIAQESGGRADAQSDAGAYGFTQLMDATARELGVDRTDPEQNLRGGARYLRQQLDSFQEVPLALAAYNAGPGAVRRFGGIPPYSETRAYVARILGVPGGEMGVSPPMRPDPIVPTPRPAVQGPNLSGDPLMALGQVVEQAPFSLTQAPAAPEQDMPMPQNQPQQTTFTRGQGQPGERIFMDLMRTMP